MPNSDLADHDDGERAASPCGSENVPVEIAATAKR